LDQQRQKHQSQIEELNDQIAQHKRMREQVDRSKGSLEQEKSELAKELEITQQARAESEKYRKQAEAKILELQHNVDEHARNKEAVDQQLNKVSYLEN
jgi:myosin protein heavy chain